MKRKTVIIAGIITGIIVTLVIAVSAIAAIPQKDDVATLTLGARATENLANVAVQKVVATGLTRTVHVNGVTAAKRDVTYAAETAGRLEYLGAEVGDAVRLGKVLAKVDYTTQCAVQLQAKASYELAAATYNRMETLGANLVSAQKIDESKYAMYGAKANLALANATAANAVVRANGRGQVAAKFVEKGEFVSPGTPLFRIVDTRTIVVEAAIPESQIDVVQKGSEVAVRIDALSDTYTGTVTAIIPQADPKSRTFTVRVELANPDGRILVGMSATLSIRTDLLENVLMVPQELVIEGATDRYVYVVEDGKAIKHTVVLGDVNDDQVVITRGIAAGDLLVSLGHRELTNQQRVRIVAAPGAM